MTWLPAAVNSNGSMRSRPNGHQTGKNRLRVVSSSSAASFRKARVSTKETKVNAPATMPQSPVAMSSTVEGIAKVQSYGSKSGVHSKLQGLMQDGLSQDSLS
eukprot:CAMPEP_0117461764 /NCGR_PEP_ID=MMETSP0784-20121206/2696_1 /TAXON_ID=39447 /ORGANISM="" /LENGTH=101 /DNA_ID=CAMNT_0005255487 /DNA_START=395 /DNA_END=697 /DNA_ORIENTATION=+